MRIRDVTSVLLSTVIARCILSIRIIMNFPAYAFGGTEMLLISLLLLVKLIMGTINF